MKGRCLSDDEKLAAQTANTEGYKARFRQWMEEFEATGTDLESLERLPMDGGRHLPPPPTLAEATARADLVIEGVVETVTSEVYHMFSLSSLLVRVESVVKGGVKPGDSITVKIAGGPFPRSSEFDPQDAVLLYDVAVPLLLPGERAVLFLEQGPYGGQVLDGEYRPQNFTDTYLVSGSNAELTPLEGNPFASEADSLTVESFFERVEALSCP